jgi:7-cyano-7-deazaguanine tRNA-ribosyltransferase
MLFGQKIRRARLGAYYLPLPTLWLGHDLKSSIRVWKYLPECPGIMLSAHQIISKQRFRDAASTRGIREELQYNGPIFFDSGGFIFQKKGSLGVSPREILSIYEQLRPDVGAVLDLPLNPLASRSANQSRWRVTLSNTRHMIGHAVRTEIAPVLHCYDVKSLKHCYRSLDAIVQDPAVLCLGSLVPLLRGSYVGSVYARRGCEQATVRRWRFITQVVSAVRRLYPHSVLHVFGVGSVSTMLLLLLLGVDSIDSVGWRLKAAFGEIQLPGLSNRSLNTSRSESRTRRALSHEDRELIARCCCPVCKTVAESRRESMLCGSYTNRAIHNAFVTVAEVVEFRSALSKGRTIEHVASRLHRHEIYANILERVILQELGNHSQEEV